MLTSIELRAPGGGTPIVFAVGIPSAGTKYFVKSVEGLGPVQADISSSSYANFDGVILDHARLGGRNIVFDLKFFPDYESSETVQDVRRILYSVAGTKKVVDLTFINDSFPTVTIRGTVETNEPTIFSKNTDVRLSILCGDPNPYFKGELVEIQGVAGVGLAVSALGDIDPGYTLTFTPPLDQTSMQLDLFDTVLHRTKILPPFGVPTAGIPVTFSAVPKAKFIHLDELGSDSYVNLLRYTSVVDFAPLSRELTMILLTGSSDLGAFTISYYPLYEGL